MPLPDAKLEKLLKSLNDGKNGENFVKKLSEDFILCSKGNSLFIGGCITTCTGIEVTERQVIVIFPVLLACYG